MGVRLVTADAETAKKLEREMSGSKGTLSHLLFKAKRSDNEIEREMTPIISKIFNNLEFNDALDFVDTFSPEKIKIVHRIKNPDFDEVAGHLKLTVQFLPVSYTEVGSSVTFANSTAVHFYDATPENKNVALRLLGVLAQELQDRYWPSLHGAALTS